LRQCTADNRQVAEHCTNLCVRSRQLRPSCGAGGPAQQSSSSSAYKVRTTHEYCAHHVRTVSPTLTWLKLYGLVRITSLLTGQHIKHSNSSWGTRPHCGHLPYTKYSAYVLQLTRVETRVQHLVACTVPPSTAPQALHSQTTLSLLRLRAHAIRLIRRDARAGHIPRQGRVPMLPMTPSHFALPPSRSTALSTRLGRGAVLGGGPWRGLSLPRRSLSPLHVALAPSPSPSPSVLPPSRPNTLAGSQWLGRTDSRQPSRPCRLPHTSPEQNHRQGLLPGVSCLGAARRMHGATYAKGGRA